MSSKVVGIKESTLLPSADITTASSLLFSSRRLSRIEPREMRERTKSGARAKKHKRGGGEKERKRWKRGDYRQYIVKKSAWPLVASEYSDWPFFAFPSTDLTT